MPWLPVVSRRAQGAACRGRSRFPPSAGRPAYRAWRGVPFRESPATTPRIGSHVVYNVLFRSLPIPPHGPENAIERRFRTECAGPGVIETASNFFNVSQARIDGPPEDEINAVDFSGEHAHPPVPLSGHALLPFSARAVGSLRPPRLRAAARSRAACAILPLRPIVKPQGPVAAPAYPTPQTHSWTRVRSFGGIVPGLHGFIRRTSPLRAQETPMAADRPGQRLQRASGAIAGRFWVVAP